MNRAWTQQRIDQAVAMFKQGATASAIAVEIGGGLSRGAVIGKLSRMGFTRANDPAAPNGGVGEVALLKRIAVARASKQSVVVAQRGAKAEKTSPAPRSGKGPATKQASLSSDAGATRAIRCDPVAPSIPAPEGGLGLMELKNCHCRWPLDVADEAGVWKFCGAQKPFTRSYCANHHAQAYRPGTESERNAVRALARMIGRAA